jgi:acyl carrier protein
MHGIREQVVGAALAEITVILRRVLRDPNLEIATDTRFEDFADWDAMDLISVVAEVECRFELQFEVVDIDRLTTVGDLLRMVSAKQALAAA